MLMRDQRRCYQIGLEKVCTAQCSHMPDIATRMFQGIQKEALETGKRGETKNLTGDVSTLSTMDNTGIFVSLSLGVLSIMFISQPFVSNVRRGSMG
jgi:hypothetical protein